EEFHGGLPPAVSTQSAQQAPAFAEIGVSGLKSFSGYIAEEDLPELRRQSGVRIYRQMAGGDPILAAILSANALILRAAEWRVEPANATLEAEKEANFVEGLFEDMSHTMEDFIAEALSMLQFGWSYHEIVLKRRIGPEESDPTRRSKFSDG